MLFSAQMHCGGHTASSEAIAIRQRITKAIILERQVDVSGVGESLQGKGQSMCKYASMGGQTASVPRNWMDHLRLIVHNLWLFSNS